jgi:FkbM family methyltransferase
MPQLLRSNLRDATATVLRALPYFRGKYRLGPALLPWITDYYNEQDCLVKVQLRDGSWMRLDLRSFPEQKAFFAGDYDGGLMRRFAAILNANSTVLDVGANVGFYAIALGRQLQQLGTGKLWAIEPVPTNCDRLRQNIQLNQLDNTVFAIQTALGNQTGTIPLHLTRGKDNLATTGNAFICQDAPNCTAPITTLDALAEQHYITTCDLIKVDIEGAELEFLRGAQQFISRCRPIIYGEFNPVWCREFGYSFLEVAALIADWDYRIYRQAGRDRFVPATPTPTLEDVLLVPAEISSALLAQLGVTGIEPCE